MNRNNYWKVYRWYCRRGWTPSPFPRSWTESDTRLAEYMYKKHQLVNKLARRDKDEI